MKRDERDYCPKEMKMEGSCPLGRRCDVSIIYNIPVVPNAQPVYVSIRFDRIPPCSEDLVLWTPLL